MPSTLFAPAPVRSVSTLPPLDLGTTGPGRYPTMAELRSFPAGQQPVYALPAQAPRSAVAQQQGGSSWYVSTGPQGRERRMSAGAAQQRPEGPPTVQGKRERRDSAGPVGPPTRRPVRPVMPTSLAQQGRGEQAQWAPQRRATAAPPQQQPVYVPMPSTSSQPLQRTQTRATALPPTTQPRGASRSPPTRPGSAGGVPFPTQPRPAAQPQQVGEDPPHPSRGPFLGAFGGHRVLRRKHAPSPSVDTAFPSAHPAGQPSPSPPRRRAWSFGRKQAPAPPPIQVPHPSQLPPQRREDIDAQGSPVEVRFSGAGGVQRFGRDVFGEDTYGPAGGERRRLRVVNGEVGESPETPFGWNAAGHGGAGAGAGRKMERERERDADGDVVMRDAAHAREMPGVGVGYGTSASASAVPAPQTRATVILPSARAARSAPAASTAGGYARAQQHQHQQQAQNAIRLQTAPGPEGKGMLLDIVRPEPRYPTGQAPVARAAVPQAQPVHHPPPQAQAQAQPVHTLAASALPAPPAPASATSSYYRNPEPSYPQRQVVYDAPNPYRPPSAQAQSAASASGHVGGYTQSAPASVARSTWSLPSSSGQSVRGGAETDQEAWARSRAAVPGYSGAAAQARGYAASSVSAGGPQVRSRLYSQSEQNYALVYGGAGQQGVQTMGNVRATSAGGEHRPHLTYEIIAAAAGFAAMRIWEDHLRSQGQQPKHSLAKEILAAIAAAEIDRLVETKGLDWLDKQRAKHDAGQTADRLVGERYPDGPAPAQGPGQGYAQPAQQEQYNSQAPREHPPPGASDQGRLRAPPPGPGQPPTVSAPSTAASAASRRSSMSAGSKPPITLFVPGAGSPWAQGGSRPASTQYAQYPAQQQGARPAAVGYGQPAHGPGHAHGEDMHRLREEEARRGKLIKRDFA